MSLSYWHEFGNWLDWGHFLIQIFGIYCWIDLHVRLFPKFEPRGRYYVYNNLFKHVNMMRLNMTIDTNLGKVKIGNLSTAAAHGESHRLLAEAKPGDDVWTIGDTHTFEYSNV